MNASVYGDETVGHARNVIEAAWPFVGRDVQLARITNAIGAAARGVLIAGPAGVGKSRLAAESLRAAEQNGMVGVRVVATPAAKSLPFAAFSAFVPDFEAGIERGDVIRLVADAIAARGAGRPVALLVDDVHALDESSAALVHHLALNQQVFLLATLRSGEVTSETVLSLWKDELLDRLDLSALTVTQVEELLAKALGSTADSATVHRLFERTEGNPLFLRELVRSAVEAGQLHDSNGLWRMVGALPASGRLVELVEARLRGLEAEHRRHLEVLALGEPLDLDLMDADLRALEARGIVRIEDEAGRQRARLGHPLFADVLRAGMGPLRTREVCRLLADRTEAADFATPQDLVRHATWRLDGGGHVRADLMLAAARHARAQWELPLAERLAVAASDAGAGVAAGVLLGQLLFLQGRAEHAEQVLAALEPAEDAEKAEVAAVRIDNLVMGLGRLDDALDVAEAAEAGIGIEGYRDAVRAQRGRCAFLFGQPGRAVDIVAPIVSHAEGPILVDACITAATAMGLNGRMDEALAITHRGHAAHKALPFPLPMGPYIHLLVRAHVLSDHGRYAEAEALQRSQHADGAATQSFEAQGLFAGFLAQTLIMRGQVATAVKYGREAATLLRERGSPFYLRLALVPLAHAQALAGQIEDAEKTLAELDDLGLPPNMRYGPELLQARAWTAVGAGDLRAAKAYLAEAVAMAGSGGHRVMLAAALHDLARLGDAREVADRLSALEQEVEGPLVRARAAHVRGLAAQDAEELDTASAAFEDMGALLLAAEAAADAAVASTAAGQARKAAAAEQRAHRLHSRCEGARTPSLRQGRAKLTAREFEIARLAAAGVPNKEIAAQLFLSLHTVQNKLHAAYEKLGVKGRAELKDALADY